MTTRWSASNILAGMAMNEPTWKLRQWRKYLKKTQQWVADQTGMHKGDISALETGAQRWNETHLTKISAALGVPRFWLVDIDPTDPANEVELLRAISELTPDKRADVLEIATAIGKRAKSS